MFGSISINWSFQFTSYRVIRIFTDDKKHKSYQMNKLKPALLIIASFFLVSCLVTQPTIRKLDSNFDPAKFTMKQAKIKYELGDNTEAAAIFKYWMEQGNDEATIYFADLAKLGKGTKYIGYDRALELILPLAEKGNAHAQHNVADIYRRKGKPRKRMYWLNLAAENKYAPSLEMLGYLYYRGSSSLVRRNYSIAQDYYYNAGLLYAEAGNRVKTLEIVDYLEKTFRAYKLANALANKIYSSGDSGSSDVSISAGTGWPIAQGYVVTSYHIVDGKTKIKVQLANGDRLDAKPVLADQANDLIFLKVENSEKLPPSLNISSNEATKGTDVFTIGFPFISVMGGNAKVTNGIVNATSGLNDDPRMYQVSTQIQPGNSGGPLLNMKGEVIGIIASKLSDIYMLRTAGSIPQNVNYAVKVSYLEALFSSLPNKTEGSDKVNFSTNSLQDMVSSLNDSILLVLAE